MDCQFCEWDKNLKERVFYENDGWAAFLAAPYHTDGHTILIRMNKNKKEENCPKELNPTVLAGMDCALAEVSEALMDCRYNETHTKPKAILFASLRGDIEHFHIHLIPLWEEEEKEWRGKQIENNHLCYEKGHLMEYLGNLERKGDKRAAKVRNENGWDSGEQRDKTIEDDDDFKSYLKKLNEYIEEKTRSGK